MYESCIASPGGEGMASAAHAEAAEARGGKKAATWRGSHANICIKCSACEGRIITIIVPCVCEFYVS